jgi:hypothetical protein
MIFTKEIRKQSNQLNSKLMYRYSIYEANKAYLPTNFSKPHSRAGLQHGYLALQRYHTSILQ